MRIELQPAYILHTRDYRDSSLLVEFLTPNYGRISGVVRGVRSTTKNARQRRGMMQSFVPLLISWSGNTDLKTITHYESKAVAVALTGQRLFSALYVNELLTRVLQHYDENSDVFLLYELTLFDLLACEQIDIVLRKFEMQLLGLMGYAIDMACEAFNAQPLQASATYRFDPGNGFIKSNASGDQSLDLFLGADLLAIAQGNYTDPIRRSAKRLCRLALSAHLGSKPLKSRELFN